MSRLLVLASTSRYRRVLLDRLGIGYRTVSPKYDEDPIPGLSAAELALAHARGKSRSLAGEFPSAIVIGCDQVVSLGSVIFEKPGTPDRAVEQLRAMRGREHTLSTALVVRDGASGVELHHLDVTSIRIRALTDAAIDAYIARENPVDCAGAYRSEGLGIALFDYQRGEDPTAVVGLPLIALVRLLGQLGVHVLAE
jgi:septum formation protein